MKNKLITTLLAFTTLALAAEHPTKKELLTNLKSIKIELQNTLSEIIIESKSNYNKAYFANIDIIWNELLALEAVAPYSFEIDFFMHILQNQKIKSLDDLCNSEFDYSPYDGLSLQDKLLKSMFLKIYHDEQTTEMVMNDFMHKERWDMAIVFNNLLQKIDIKIKELEAQA